MSFNAWELEEDKRTYDMWTRRESKDLGVPGKPAVKKALTDGQEKAVGILARDLTSQVERVVDEYAALVASNGTVKPTRMQKASPYPFKVKAGDDLNSMSIEELIVWLGEHDPRALIDIANYIRKQYGDE